MRSCIALAVAFVAAAALSSTAFGGVWTPVQAGDTTYGSDAYGFLGINNTKSWELFRKEQYSSSAVSYSTAANVPGNNTLMTIDQQWLDFTHNSYTGSLMFGTAATTTVSPSAPFMLSGVTDLTGKLDNADLRIGFMESPSAFVAGNYDASNYDPGATEFTNAVYIHTNISNAGPTGWAWQAPVQAELCAGASGEGEGARTNLMTSNTGNTPITGFSQVMVNGGTIPTVPWSDGDPTSGTNWLGAGAGAGLDISMNIVSTGANSALFTVKMGNELISLPVNTADPGNPDHVGYDNGKLDLTKLVPFIYFGEGNGSLGTAAPATAKFGLALPGDVNGDGVVNIGDLTAMASHWGQTNQVFSTGDVNGDGLVNIGDLTVLASHWNSAAAGESFKQALAAFPQLSAAMAPEPSTLILLVAGILGFATRLFVKARKLNTFSLLGVHRMKKIVALLAVVAILGMTAGAYGFVVNPSDLAVTFTAESSPVAGWTGYLVNVVSTDSQVQGFDFGTVAGGNGGTNFGFTGTFSQDWTPGKSGATSTPSAPSYSAGLVSNGNLDSFLIVPSDATVAPGLVPTENGPLGAAVPGNPGSDAYDSYGTDTKITGTWANTLAEAASSVSVAYLVCPTGQLPTFDMAVSTKNGVASYELKSTPEPATLVLLISGVALMLGRFVIRRRRA